MGTRTTGSGRCWRPFAGRPVPAREDIPAKQRLILDHGLALWDVLASCTITGASDASIRDPVPNDFAALLEGAPIQAVFCNGTAAWKMYTKYVQPVTALRRCGCPAPARPTRPVRPRHWRKYGAQRWGLGS